jgi:hypothetical protein
LSSPSSAPSSTRYRWPLRGSLGRHRPPPAPPPSRRGAAFGLRSAAGTGPPPVPARLPGPPPTAVPAIRQEKNAASEGFYGPGASLGLPRLGRLVASHWSLRRKYNNYCGAECWVLLKPVARKPRPRAGKKSEKKNPGKVGFCPRFPLNGLAALVE